MKYFESLIPQITQDQDTFFNMFFNFDITVDIPQEFLVTYNLKDSETLQEVAYSFFDDPQLYWVLCLINSIQDPLFDIAKSDEYVQQVATELAAFNPLFWTGDDTDLFWTGSDEDPFWFLQADFFNEYEAETDRNELKRTINVVKAEFLPDVLAQVLSLANQ